MEAIKISGINFITEKTNIKDHYKITSCIGRGILSLPPSRGLRRSAQVPAEGDEGAAGGQNHQQEGARGGRQGETPQ